MKKEKEMWCIRKQGGPVVAGIDGTKYWATKEAAKFERNELQRKKFGELPENPDHTSVWMFNVSPGPDHWRAR